MRERRWLCFNSDAEIDGWLADMPLPAPTITAADCAIFETYIVLDSGDGACGAHTLSSCIQRAAKQVDATCVYVTLWG